MVQGCSSAQRTHTQLAVRFLPAHPEHLLGSICLVVLALGVCLPFALRPFPQGDDFPFHVSSWIDVVSHWRQGDAFPAWNGLQAYGLGEPTYLFYPPLSLYIGASLTWIFGATTAPAAFCGLCVLIAGGSMRFFASESLDNRRSWIAALIYAANPYLLLDLWIRNAFAESLAIALFPLALRAVTKLRDLRTAIILALSLALIFFCNLPSAVIAVYSLGALTTVRAVAERNYRVLLYGTVAVAMAAAFSAVVILPALGNQHSVQIANLQAFDPASFLPNRSLFGVAMLLFCAITFATQIAGKLHGERASWKSIFIVSNLAVLMMTRLSLPLYKVLPALSKIQFPYRWLLVLSALAAVMLVASVQLSKVLQKIGFATVSIVVTTVLVSIVILLSAHMNRSLVSGKRVGWGSQQSLTMLTRPVGEYLPIGAPNISELASLSRKFQHEYLLSIQQATIQDWNIEKRSLIVTNPAASVLRLPILLHSGWHAEVDGASVPLMSIDGAIALQVPSGRHLVSLAFQPPLRVWGFWISLLTILFASASLLLHKRVVSNLSSQPTK